MTAEVAIVTPAVLLIVGALSLGVATLGQQVAMSSAVHAASRWIAAGNPGEAQQQLRRAVPAAAITYTGSVGHGCLHATKDVRLVITVAHLEAEECVDVPPPV